METGNKKEFEGNKTLTQIVKHWKKFSELESRKQEQFVTDLLTIFVERDLERRLINFWKLSNDEAKKLIQKSKLPKGYINYSEKAIKKFLPIMKDTGMNDRKIIANLQQEGKFPKERNKYAEMDIWCDEISL